MNIFTIQIQTQTQKINLWLPKGKGGDKLGVWDLIDQASKYKTDNQQDPMYSTGKYIQYLIVINEKKNKRPLEIVI